MSAPDDSGTPGSALFPNRAFDLAVMGASAGGLSVLKSILAGLPPFFSTPIAVVQHTPALAHSMLAQVLGWRARLPTKLAEHGDRLRSGTVFVAPPRTHLIVGRQRRFELEDSPHVHAVCPAADRLFTTAAAQLGARVLCIVLTGMGRDGAAGAAAVKRRGGMVIVQDPQTAYAPGMPQAALDACNPHLVLPPEAIPRALASLCEVSGTRELICGPRARRRIA